MISVRNNLHYVQQATDVPQATVPQATVPQANEHGLGFLPEKPCWLLHRTANLHLQRLLPWQLRSPNKCSAQPKTICKPTSSRPTHGKPGFGQPKRSGKSHTRSTTRQRTNYRPSFVFPRRLVLSRRLILSRRPGFDARSPSHTV